MRVEGRVRIGPFGGVSKSARSHQAFLETDDGARYRLRRLGGNPMRDPELEALEGARVVAEGDLRGSLFVASSLARAEDDAG